MVIIRDFSNLHFKDKIRTILKSYKLSGYGFIIRFWFYNKCGGKCPRKNKKDEHNN